MCTFLASGKGVRNSSPTPARSGNEWLRYRDIALARRCRVRYGGFVPAGGTKLGDQWRMSMISRCGRACPRAGFRASFNSAGGPLLGNTVPIVVPRAGRLPGAPRPPQPLRSLGVVCDGTETICSSFVDKPRAGGLFLKTRKRIKLQLNFIKI